MYIYIYCMYIYIYIVYIYTHIQMCIHTYMGVWIDGCLLTFGLLLLGKFGTCPGGGSWFGITGTVVILDF